MGREGELGVFQRAHSRGLKRRDNERELGTRSFAVLLVCDRVLHTALWHRPPQGQARALFLFREVAWIRTKMGGSSAGFRTVL